MKARSQFVHAFLMLPAFSCFAMEEPMPHSLGDWHVFSVPESALDTGDLNGDGDLLDPVLIVENLATGTVRNLGLGDVGQPANSQALVENGPWGVPEDRFVFHKSAELNSELPAGTYDYVFHTGETSPLPPLWRWVLWNDKVVYFSRTPNGGSELHVYDLENRSTIDLGLSSACEGGEQEFGLSGRWLVMSVRENDGVFLYFHDLESAETFRPGLRTAFVGDAGPPCFTVTGGDWVLIPHSPPRKGVLFNMASRSRYEAEIPWWSAALSPRWVAWASGSSEPAGVTILELQTGRSLEYGDLRPIGNSLCVRGHLLFFSVSEATNAEDLNGDGDSEDVVLQIVDLQEVFAKDPSALLRRGDCNDDGTMDMSDAVFGLASLFWGQGPLRCHDACDSNDDGSIDISDAITTLGFLFLGQAPIPFPGVTECGVDPTEDDLECALSQCAAGS